MSPVNVTTIGAYIKEQREQARISLRQLAQNAGISNPYLSQIERGLRRPSADILQQIAKGLRISAEALYVQAGFLEDRPPGSVVRDAVLADPELTERQKQMLIEIYESFRKETALAAEADEDDEAAAEAADQSLLAPDEAALLWPENLSAEALEVGPAQPAIEPDPFPGQPPAPVAEPPAAVAEPPASSPGTSDDHAMTPPPARGYPLPPDSE
ncbi:MAG TPA: helix-turn-helix transcriptional regulator [Streptosporangiaceae bacterium]|jgi:transcriptional regulator with XRE-family HTH domain